MASRELFVLAVIWFAGIALRTALPERMAVEHFDEGVYASNWYCRPPGLPELVFPNQHLYAPPLLPELLRWVLFFSGGAPRAVLGVNVVAGALLLPVVWWMAREWFGPRSGLAAAALCAASDLHIVLSRMVLTDALLVLFLCAGVWSGTRAVWTGRPGWIVLGGLLAALAWWTKYNGWLTLAITAAGLTGWCAFSRPRGLPWGPLAVRWFVMAAIALALWSPVLWGLQRHGGYAAVAQNHARYLVGLSGWLDACRQLVSRVAQFDSVAGWGLLLLLVGWTTAAATASQPLGKRVVILLLATAGTLAAVLMLGGPLTLGLVAAGGLIRGFRRQSTTSAQTVAQTGGCPLAGWTVAAWVAGLGLLTPLYTPYPRLAMPLTAGLWLAAAMLLRSEADSPSSEDVTAALLRTGLPLVLLVLVCLAGLIGTGVAPGPAPWEDRRGLEQLAGPIVSAAEAETGRRSARDSHGLQAVFYVYAEPALFYHLSAHEPHAPLRYLVQPIGDHGLLETGPPEPRLTTFLVTGPHADEVAADATQFRAAEEAGRLRLVATFPYRPSQAVLLDRLSPRELPQAREQTIRLYLLAP
jgi:4-amino-4-deoxy-L-arabinose transferase-like glycosyltransferase